MHIIAVVGLPIHAEIVLCVGYRRQCHCWPKFSLVHLVSKIQAIAVKEHLVSHAVPVVAKSQNGWVHSRQGWESGYHHNKGYPFPLFAMDHLVPVVLFAIALVLGQSTGRSQFLMTSLISTLTTAGSTRFKIQHPLDAWMSALYMDVSSAAGSLHLLWQCRFDHQAQHPSLWQYTICEAQCQLVARLQYDMTSVMLSGYTQRQDPLRCLASTLLASHLLP